MTESTRVAPRPPEAPPSVALQALDQLWFQITGTLCNLTCTHCFISCSPTNHAFGFLPIETMRRHLRASVELGVKEYFFTGGEPFMHPEILTVLEETLTLGPATVLTNGTLLRDGVVERLAAIEAASAYSLELRVSLDACTPEENDAIRGPGVFARAMAGIGKLVAAGFLPIVTASRPWDGDDARAFHDFVRVLQDAGYARPRIKMIPILKMGAEERRGHGYAEDHWVSAEMLARSDPADFLCSHARIVTDRGVHVCPIAIEEEGSRLADDLTGAAFEPYPLRHQACYSCYLWGAICSNASSGSSGRSSVT